MAGQALSVAQVGVLNVFSRPQLELIQRTVAKDCNDVEFDTFITLSAKLRLDPLKRQIYAFVFSKDNPKKRNMVLVTAIGGLRTIAERTGHYRPDDALPVYEYDESAKNPDSNPLGLVSATVRVWQHKHGDWHPIPHQVFWDAYAPLTEAGEWIATGETYPDGNPKKEFKGNGKFMLDPGKPRWRIDGRGMLAKCAEAGALRKGWPDEMAGVYSDDELESVNRRAKEVELQPSEYAEQQRVDNRVAAIQGKDSILFEFPPEGLAPTPIGQIFDKAMGYFKEQGNKADVIEYWIDRNRYGLQEFWARAGTDCLALKKTMEKMIAESKANDKKETAES